MSRFFFRIRILSSYMLLGIGLLGCQNEEQHRPSIIFIYADDLGWRDVGIMGSRYYETPHIDRLAEDGMRFTRAYANAPNCAPSRASLMTGRYSPRHGIYTVNSAARGKSRNRKLIPVENKTALAPGTDTFVRHLNEAGYRTGMVGKWHLGAGESDPKAFGFEWSRGSNHFGTPPSYFYPYARGNAVLPEVSEGGFEGEYLTDRLTDEAIRFIRTNKDEPYFLFVSHYAVHTPIQAKSELVELFEDRMADGGQANPTYAAMIKSLDESVGRIRALVDSLDQSENTFFVFYSDNGGHGHFTDMTPLRGAKGMLYEGGIRVPMIVAWSGHVQPGRVDDTPVLGVDWFNTVLELGNVQTPSASRSDGVNLLPLMLNSQKPANRSLFWHFPAYLESSGNREAFWRTTPASAVLDGPYKLIHFFEDERWELYNLENDLGENENLAETDVAVKIRLEEILRLWWAETGAFIPTAFNPEYVD